MTYNCSAGQDCARRLLLSAARRRGFKSPKGLWIIAITLLFVAIGAPQVRADESYSLTFVDLYEYPPPVFTGQNTFDFDPAANEFISSEPITWFINTSFDLANLTLSPVAISADAHAINLLTDPFAYACHSDLDSTYCVVYDGYTDIGTILSGVTTGNYGALRDDNPVVVDDSGRVYFKLIQQDMGSGSDSGEGSGSGSGTTNTVPDPKSLSLALVGICTLGFLISKRKVAPFGSAS